MIYRRSKISWLASNWTNDIVNRWTEACSAGLIFNNKINDFLIFILGKNMLDETDVEFNFMIGYVLVIFLLLWKINEKCKVWINQIYCPSQLPKLINIVPNTLFSPNLLIIITGTFRNTPNPLKRYEITIFISLLFCLWKHRADDSQTSNACHRFKFPLQRPEIFRQFPIA